VNWLKSILAVVVVVVLASVIALQYVSVAKLRLENGALRRQLEQLTQAQPAGDSATNSAGNANDLSESQLAELLQLRGEATQLREQTNAIAAVSRENEALIASLKEKNSSAARSSEQRSKKSAEDALPQDIHPKESWGYRGYGSPEATVESMLWAASHGDKAGFMAGFPPELQEKFAKDFQDKDLAAEVKKNEIQEFRVLDRQTVSDDEMVLTVYMARQGNENANGSSSTEDTHFKKIDGQWRVSPN
jgi:hypothetical protein